MENCTPPPLYIHVEIERDVDAIVSVLSPSHMESLIYKNPTLRCLEAKSRSSAPRSSGRRRPEMSVLPVMEETSTWGMDGTPKDSPNMAPIFPCGTTSGVQGRVS